jgi:hypothetical protein
MEWNVALNGFVPFTIVVDSGASAATAGLARPWSIMAALLPCPPWGERLVEGVMREEIVEAPSPSLSP